MGAMPSRSDVLGSLVNTGATVAVTKGDLQRAVSQLNQVLPHVLEWINDNSILDNVEILLWNAKFESGSIRSQQDVCVCVAQGGKAVV